MFTPGAGREVVRHFLSMRVEAVVFIGHFHREETEARIAELITHVTPHLVIDHSGLHNANTISLDRTAAWMLGGFLAMLYFVGLAGNWRV